MTEFTPCEGCDEPEACEIVSRCLEPTEEPHLSESDVLTLMGHAHYLLAVKGQNDMPRWFYGLAERIALSLGDRHLAERVAAVAHQEFANAPASS